MKPGYSKTGMFISFFLAVFWAVIMIPKLSQEGITQQYIILDVLLIVVFMILSVACGILYYTAQYIPFEKKGSADIAGVAITFIGVVIFTLGFYKFSSFELTNIEINRAVLVVANIVIAFSLLGLVVWMAINTKKVNGDT